MKDPAFMFYYRDWITGTAAMTAEVRGWYINLLAHQADKGALPDDQELLAQLAGVSYSDFSKFGQCWKRTLEAKFTADPKAPSEKKLQNQKLAKVMAERGSYREKQSQRGTVGAFLKKLKADKEHDPRFIELLKANLFKIPKSNLTHQKMEECYKHTLKQYANVNEDVNESIDKEVIEEKSMELFKPNDIPSLEQFIGYVKDMDPQFSKKLDNIRFKYLAWEENNWCDGNNKPIKNWKSKLLHTLPHIQPDSQLSKKPSSQIDKLKQI